MCREDAFDVRLLITPPDPYEERCSKTTSTETINPDSTGDIRVRKVKRISLSEFDSVQQFLDVSFGSLR